jgi:hypothetical protein
VKHVLLGRRVDDRSLSFYALTETICQHTSTSSTGNSRCCILTEVTRCRWWCQRSSMHPMDRVTFLGEEVGKKCRIDPCSWLLSQSVIYPAIRAPWERLRYFSWQKGKRRYFLPGPKTRRHISHRDGPKKSMLHQASSLGWEQVWILKPANGIPSAIAGWCSAFSASRVRHLLQRPRLTYVTEYGLVLRGSRAEGQTFNRSDYPSVQFRLRIWSLETGLIVFFKVNSRHFIDQ